jgi:hypothetical protein
MRSESDKLHLASNAVNSKEKEAPLVSLRELLTSEELYSELEFVTITCKT